MFLPILYLCLRNSYSFNILLLLTCFYFLIKKRARLLLVFLNGTSLLLLNISRGGEVYSFPEGPCVSKFFFHHHRYSPKQN